MLANWGENELWGSCNDAAAAFEILIKRNNFLIEQHRALIVPAESFSIISSN